LGREGRQRAAGPGRAAQPGRLRRAHHHHPGHGRRGDLPQPRHLGHLRTAVPAQVAVPQAMTDRPHGSTSMESGPAADTIATADESIEPRALQILSTVFGYEAFRGQQAEIIEQVTSGGDAVVLMPTGGGKSLCYQIPALAREGTGVVVSPLIALMADQVAALDAVGIRAAYLNSTLDAHQARAVEQQLLDGELDLLYMAPERLV